MSLFRVGTKAVTSEGLEQQIIDRTHAFGESEVILTKKDYDGMYQTHGSTIERIRCKLMTKGEEERTHKVHSHYYQYVYDGIDMTRLLPSIELSLVNTG